MQKEETSEIIEGLQKQHSNKFKFLIIVFSIIGIILFLVLLISAYLYFKSPEKTLGIGANIESALLSSDGNLVYVKLLGGSLDKNITKIKFIFTDEQGNEYVYETSEGIKEIEVPFKKSFWDWLFGKPAFSGEYDYEINANEIDLANFENIDEVSVLFEYQTETGDVIETPTLDTQRTTNQTSSSSSSSSSSSNTNNPACTPESKTTTCGTGFCGIKKNNCSEDVDCGNCNINENCIDGICIPNFCSSITDCSNYADETNCTTDFCDKGICKWNSSLESCYNYAGNVYYVSVTGAGSHNGSSPENAFNLKEAQAYANVNVDETITFLLASGGYGDFIDTSPVERTAWVTWKAKEAHSPELTKIDVNWNGPSKEVYLKFDGITIRPEFDDKHAISVRYSNHTQFLNLNVIGQGARYTSKGFNARYINYVTLDNSIFSGGTKQGRYDGFDDVSYFRDAGRNIVVTNNEMRQFKGIGVALPASDSIVSNNSIHKFGGDGIIFGSGSGNLLIENNKIHDIQVYYPELQETPTETTWSANGTTMYNPDANWGSADEPFHWEVNIEIVVISGNNVNTGDNEIRVAQVVSPTEIVFDGSIGSTPGVAPSNVDYYLRDQVHADLIQATAGYGTYFNNITIRGNELYDSLDGWAFMHLQAQDYDNPDLNIGGSNWLVENNLCWNSYANGQEENGAPLNLRHIDGAIFRNNTVIGRVQLRYNHNVNFTNNIISFIDVYDTAGLVDNDYNIFNRGGFSSNYSLGPNTIFLYPSINEDKWNASAFTDIFVDYYGGNFRPTMDKIACNGTINLPEVVVGALPCACLKDADCIYGGTCTDGQCIGTKNCFGTDTHCGSFPNCENCNWQDGCVGNEYRDYYCSGNTCVVFSSDDCTDCSCSCGGYGEVESIENGNCGDGIDNDCDGNLDSLDHGCQAPTGLPDGYVGYYRFEGTTYDYTGNNMGVWGGDEEIYSERITDNYALEFDGVNDYVTVGTGTDFSDICVNGCSFSAWVKEYDTGADNTIVGRYDNSLHSSLKNLFLLFSISATDQVTFSVSYNGTGETGTGCSSTAGSKVISGAWHHVAGVYNTTDVIVYNNAVPGTATTCTYSGISLTDWQRSEDTFIGVTDDGSYLYDFNGSIDDVMIFNRSLSTLEIQKIYCSQGGSAGFCGQFGSFSPFTQLLNFLKSLLTGRTGQAILTGNAVNETNETGKYKIPYIILSLLIGIILIIAIVIIVKIKKNKKKKLRERKKKR